MNGYDAFEARAGMGNSQQAPCLQWQMLNVVTDTTNGIRNATDFAVALVPGGSFMLAYEAGSAALDLSREDYVSAAVPIGFGASMMAGDALMRSACNSELGRLTRRVTAKLDLYPRVHDPRTGRAIHFPADIQAPIPRAQRVKWNSNERRKFIAEWHRRGYPTPRGGWEHYHVHHIKPRLFGGSNDFWNLVPVERSNHELFNEYWANFGGL